MLDGLKGAELLEVADAILGARDAWAPDPVDVPCWWPAKCEAAKRLRGSATILRRALEMFGGDDLRGALDGTEEEIRVGIRSVCWSIVGWWSYLCLDVSISAPSDRTIVHIESAPGGPGWMGTASPLEAAMAEIVIDMRAWAQERGAR